MDIKKTSALSSRLEGLDLARYFALIGMVFVNFHVVMTEGLPPEVSHNFTAYLEGRAAALFVVLAGTGMGLSAARYAWPDTVSTTLKRSLFLLILGLIDMMIFDADIIHYYAFYFVFGLPLLRARGGVIWAVIFGLIIVAFFMIVFLDFDKGWIWETYSYQDFLTPRGFIRNLFYNGWHPIIPWLAYFLFGVLLARLNLRARRVQTKLFIVGALVFTAIVALSYILTQGAEPDDAVLFSTSPVPALPFYMFSGGAFAAAMIGLCLKAEPILRAEGILQLFTPAGRQTLTLYIAHIVTGMGILEALGLLTLQPSYKATIAATLFCTLATIYAVIWTRYFKRGPLEALMRRITG